MVKFVGHTLFWFCWPCCSSEVLLDIHFAVVKKQVTIIERGWAKYRDLSVASRSIICRSRGLRQIIDVRDTGKSRYFAITEFSNCFIIRSPSLFFNEYLREAKRSAFFHSRTITRGFLYAWAEYYLQPNTVGQHCTCADHYLLAVICRSRGGLSANEKKEKFASNDNCHS